MKLKQTKKINKRAFEKLITTHGKSLYSYIYSLTKTVHLTEDIYQDVWIKIYNHYDKYDTSKPFSAWAVTIARNTVYDHYKKTKKAPIPLHETPITIDPEQPLDEVLKKERSEELARSLDALNERNKNLILLRYFEEKSYQEIADHYNVEVKTIKWQLFEAKKRLKKQVDGKEDILWNVK